MKIKLLLTMVAVLLASLLGFASCSLWKVQGDLFPVQQNQKCGYIDNAGKKVIEPQFESADKFSEGLAVVEIGQKIDERIESKVAYVDKTGKIIIERQFDGASDFHEGLASVRVFGDKSTNLKTEFGYIDKSGKYVIKPQFDEVYDFSEGLAASRTSKNEIR